MFFLLYGTSNVLAKICILLSLNHVNSIRPLLIKVHHFENYLLWYLIIFFFLFLGNTTKSEVISDDHNSTSTRRVSEGLDEGHREGAAKGRGAC